MTASPSIVARPARLGNLEFVVLMAMIQALQALAVDSMLPALGQMSVDLHVANPNQRQLVVGVFLICAGLGSLIPGTLADRFGRRRALFFCLSSYVTLTTACALATDFPLLLGARALLGLACSGLMVLPATIIRDRLEGDAMARMQSTVAMVFMIVPMLAPSVGQAVLAVAGWRWIFGMMAVLGLAVAGWAFVRLPETLRPEFRQSIVPLQILRTMIHVVTLREAFGYVFAMAGVQGAMFAYINSSQQLVAEHFGAGARFPLIFAGMAAMMASANFVNSRIVERFGARRVSHTALLIAIVTSLTQLALASRPGETLWQFVPVMTVNMCMLGFLGANFSSIALQPFARNAGAAASGQSFVRMVLAAGLGSLVGQAYDGTARPLAMTLVGTAVVGLALVLVSERGRLFRRVLPPGSRREMGFS